LILLDTSILIASLTSPRPLFPSLQKVLGQAERLIVPTIVLFEWWRGPRLEHELASQEAVFPSELAIPFGVPEAAMAARLYRQVRRARSREIDLAIAACAMVREIPLWTLNRDDFTDIPGLTLARRDYTKDV
jgi:predicted nucleic acid-binding protein